MFDWYNGIKGVLIDWLIDCCNRVASPGLSTETVSGSYERELNRNDATDNETMLAIANMLQGGSQSQSVYDVFDSLAYDVNDKLVLLLLWGPLIIVLWEEIITVIMNEWFICQTKHRHSTEIIKKQYDRNGAAAEAALTYVTMKNRQTSQHSNTELITMMLVRVSLKRELASCLINVWPQNGHDQSALRSWHCHLNMFFYWTRFIWQQCAVRYFCEINLVQ